MSSEFNESNTVEAYLRDQLCGADQHHTAAGLGFATHGGKRSGVGWHFIAHQHLPRHTTEVFVEDFVRDALVRLNPCIAAQPDRADEVLFKLRSLVLSVRDDGVVKANEGFTAWLRNERSMPFGENHQHEPITLIDFEHPENNHYVVTQQYTYRAGKTEKRPDLVLLVNGLPLVIIEAKTPVRPATSWVDGAQDIQAYERVVPELFVCNVLSVATEGKSLRYGSLGADLTRWGPWRSDAAKPPRGLAGLKAAIRGLLAPTTLLDLLANFTLFATDKKKRRSKIVARYQQYHAANAIVQRVIAGRPRRGLIWHFQGSGKSLLMVFAAQKLRMTPALKNPTVIIVVDRIDLDTQISATFHAAQIPNLVKADSRQALGDMLARDTRKVIITTIFKFAEAQGELNAGERIIVLVDEAHRTQEGDLGIAMRTALPNAFMFGLTGTPINTRDRNTFYAFGAEEDAKGYMSKYGFEDSIRDGATLELRFEPRLVELHIDKEGIDEAYKTLTGSLSDLERNQLAKQASKMAVLVRTPQRVERVCEDIAEHFKEKVAPNGFKGMVVTYDQECCLLYKAALDRHLGPDAVDVVISGAGKEKDDTRYKAFQRSRDAEEALLDRFRDAKDPLQILVVTAKLLTGFDAPILQAMYLDKPLRNHTLLQAICRVNRRYDDQKKHGLVVDYLGVFDDVAKALDFDESGFQKVIGNIAALIKQLPGAIQKCMQYFIGVDRTVSGYEGLIAAQECIPTNDVRDAFAADFSVVNRLWEAISPDPALEMFKPDYRWLAQVYESVKPTSGRGALLWHALGAKTIDLIHQNTKVGQIRDDLDTLVVDADLLDAITGSDDPAKKTKEIEIKVIARLRKHGGKPRFKALSVRLEELKARHEAGLMHSVEFLKALLQLAHDLLEAEKTIPPEEDEDRGKAALTELFSETQSAATPVVVKRIVDDIDSIVRVVRFDGWQRTARGEREVRKNLRRTLFKYKLHSDAELFEKAYDYIRQYY